MKKIPNTFKLLILLVILIGVAYLVIQKPGEQSAESGEGEYYINFDSSSVDKIIISSPSKVFVLEKKGIEWFVEKPVTYHADQSNITGLLNTLKNMKLKSVVSSNPEKQSVFQVDTNSTKLQLFEKGQEKLSLYVGKMGQSYTDTYVRKSNSNDVALVNQSLSTIVNRELKEWRDRVILTTPKEKISSIRFKYEKDVFILEKKDTLWFIGKDIADDNNVNSLMGYLTKIEADGFNDTLVSPPVKPTAVISFAGAEVRFYKSKDATQYLVQTSTSPQWFEVQSWRAEQILKQKKDLVKK